MKPKDFNIFPYQWTCADELNDEHFQQSVIRIYGWNELNETVYVRVDDYQIPMWVELPTSIEWTETKKRKICNYFLKLNDHVGYRPSDISFVDRYKLYDGSVKLRPNQQSDSTDANLKYEHKKHPFLRLLFHSAEAMKSMKYNIHNREKFVPEMGKLTMKCHVFENNKTPVIKLLAEAKLPSANWIQAKGTKIKGSEKESTKKHEYIVSWKDLKSHPESEKLPIVHPKVLSFDGEMYSSDPNGAMCKASRPNDVIIQIGATLAQKGKPTQKFLFHCGESIITLEDTTVFDCETESLMIAKFAHFVREQDPDIMMGYNIFGFDIPYINTRATEINNISELGSKLGSIPGKKTEYFESNWSSSGRGTVSLQYWMTEGRIWLDMMTYIKMQFPNLSTYRLDAVCDTFLKNQNKDPIKPKDINDSWKHKDWALFTKVGKYCVQDCYVVQLLFEKLMTWFDLFESATTCCVPIMDIYTKGQQNRIFSQVLRYSLHNNIVVESNVVSTKDKFVGASVTDPIPGLYKTILPFDFASLYPSIMMAHNIDYSKLIVDDSIPEEDCHIFEWEDHICCNCPKDTCKGQKPEKFKDGTPKIFCKAHRYRFLKSSLGGKGVLPTILENLISARKNTRKIIANNEKLIERLRSESGDQQTIDDLEEVNEVLNKRQLSYKIAANSMYGSMGVTEGVLPFLTGAQCVTAKGRQSIRLASDTLEQKFGGRVIYNDTDSAYTYFPHLVNKTPQEIWTFANDVVEKIKELFPPPMKLEFEDKVYYKFLIFCKKKYVGQTMDEKGQLDEKLTKRGIVLTRRDNCPLLKIIYEKNINYILSNFETIVSINKSQTTKEMIRNSPELQELIVDQIDLINHMFALYYDYKNFVLVKGYKQAEYKTKTPPPHVAVVNKQKKRGIHIAVGDRVEYVVLDNGNNYKKSESQTENVEALDFFADYKSILKLSYIYYLKSFVLPVGQIFDVVFYLRFPVFKRVKEEVYKLDSSAKTKNKLKKHIVYKYEKTKVTKNLYEEQFELRILKNRYINQLKDYFQPEIEFVDEVEDEEILVIKTKKNIR
jgi:DNA polymerase elongation subunit (family B)